jgi:small-conductance mechanosensitive channel
MFALAPAWGLPREDPPRWGGFVFAGFIIGGVGGLRRRYGAGTRPAARLREGKPGGVVVAAIVRGVSHFADSALVFELRAFLRDVEKQVRVGSDLRFAVESALREAEIELPYPQHDIRLRDIDRLEAAIAAISRQVADAGGKSSPAFRKAVNSRRG